MHRDWDFYKIIYESGMSSSCQHCMHERENSILYLIYYFSDLVVILFFKVHNVNKKHESVFNGLSEQF